MTNTTLDIKRKRALPEWQSTAGGKKKTLGGRMSKERLAQELVDCRHKTFTLAELAVLVYGSNCAANRDKVRRQIPGLRNYMLALLTPFVTTYGPRGTIESIKVYEPDEADDVNRINVELQRLRDRNEITKERYDKLREALSLPLYKPEQ